MEPEVGGEALPCWLTCPLLLLQRRSRRSSAQEEQDSLMSRLDEGLDEFFCKLSFR